MPSEAQSQEPRDRGPAPPVTRAGRSAQLAKAAATSPAPERRSRGRPRKDGSSSRSAPPTPPPPPPPPPPPKSRKKGRSRGRAQVEDEESMDATEKKPPQKTEVKEKTAGRRRSTSRRKTNANPEPDPDPDPDPDPPQPDPTVLASSPEPAPSAEEEDRTSPAPAPPLPASSPGEEPRVSFPPPSPSPASSPRPAPAPAPAPDPVEEDRPSPSHSPSTVPMETEGGGALSPCSSPPVSPCPRLEDEDSLSPLFQLSLSEDSGGSPTPSLGHTKKRLKQCAFCYRGDEPPLGQGRLVVFGPTPGYIPLHILNRRASSDRDNDCHDHCYRGDQAPPTCSSPEQCEEESSSEFVEQLGPVGLPHDINVQSLFDPTGQCCAHLQCAAWSEGVCRGEGQSLLYVDKAIDSGSTQVCAFCRRLGASLRCQETGCRRSFHFPCAAAAGAYQDWTKRHTLCTRHTHTASSQCASCSSGGDVGSLLMCCCCGDRYHGSCLNHPLASSPLCRAGWQCPRCQVCQSCRLRGDDGALLVCERCDKAYHTHCLTPPLDHTPSTGWSCKNCRICRRCGVRSSGQWANHPFLCKSCDPALPCPLCDHAPDLYTPQDYLTCICCYRCVHTECLVQAGEGRAGSEDYICSTCRPQEEEPIPHTPIARSPTLAPQLSPTQAPPISISQPPIPGLTEAPPISPTAHSPVHLICSEPPQSPTKTLCTPSQQSLASSHPEPTEPQHSPAPSHPEPTELQLSPVPSHPEPTELQHSPAPSHPEPTDLQHTPAPSHPEPTELQHSPAPSHPQLIELQRSPAPSHPEPTELQHSPAPSHPQLIELQRSPAPSHPEPTELQHSPAPSHPEPTELQLSPAPSHPQLIELQRSPTPSHPEPTELQHSPAAPSHPEPTELQHSPAPSHPEPTELQHSPAPSHPEPTELQHSPAPSHPELTELQHSPAPSHPEPTELQHSPAPSRPEPSELHHSPAPSHPELTELQHSPASSHPEPTELQRSPAPSWPEPTEPQHSPTPSHPESTELQHSPAPSHPEPTELKHSPAPSHPEPTELKHNLASSHPEPTEIQHSPAPSHSEPTELQHSPAPSHSEPTELQHSPAPSHSEPTEPQRSPAPSHPEPTELQHSPALSHPEPTELQHSPTQSHPEPIELQHSPAPSHPEPTELQHSPAPSHPEPTELQHSPEPTELQRSPAPSHPEPTELQHSPAPSLLEPKEDQQSLAPSHPEPSELPHSPASSHLEPTELEQNPSPSHLDSTELQQSLSPSHPDSTELQQSLSPSHPYSTEPHEISTPSHVNGKVLQRSPPPFHLNPTELLQSSRPSHFGLTELLPSVSPNLTEHQESHTPSQVSPAELQQSPTSVTPLQAQNSQLSFTSSNSTNNSTQDQLLATESQQSPTRGSPMSCSHAHSQHSPPPQTPVGHSLTQVQLGPAEPEQSPLPHSQVQDNPTQTLFDRPCSPTNIVIIQPQHSPMPHSPAQVGTSPPQSPTQDAEHTLDQESPGSSSPAELQCGPAQDISTLDQELSTVCRRPTKTARRHASPRPISAPCSPSPSSLRATQCSLSQPASPVQAHSTQPFRPLQLSLLPSQLAAQSRVTKECTKTSTIELTSLEHSPVQLIPNLDGQTLESSPNPLSPISDLSTMRPDSHGTDGKLPNQCGPGQSSVLSPDHSSLHHGPAMSTPESLVQLSTSMEHSSLTCSPCADEREEIPPTASYSHQSPSCYSPSRCTEAIEGKTSPIHIQNSSASASPKHASQMPMSPASSVQACSSPMQVETIPAHISPVATETSLSTQPASPVTLPVQPVGPLALPVRSAKQPASPPAVLARSVHPISCQDEEMEEHVNHHSHLIHPETSPGHPNHTLDNRVHSSPTHVSPVHTEANSGYSLMGSMRVPERTSAAVCGFVETQASPRLPGQSDPSHVPTTCSSSPSAVQTSPLPSPTSFSPPHCRPADTSPASSSHSHSLSHSGQTSSPSASITDVSHSPPRSSPAGQASPVHKQSTSCIAHSGPVQRQTPSLASMTYSSPAHSAVACDSPPYSPAQASEEYCSPTGSPHYTPGLDTGTSSGLTVAQLSPTLASSRLDVDMVASSVIRSCVFPTVVQLDSGLVKPAVSIKQTSPAPASSQLYDSPAVCPNQASLIQGSQSPARPLPTPDKSVVESQESTASGSPLYQRPATPVDATSTLASPSHASLVHSSPTQDNTVMPSTSHISKTPASSPPSAPSHSSPPHAPQAQASSVHSSPVASPVCSPLQSGDTQENPRPTSSLRPEASPSPGPGSPFSCEAGPGPGSVRPVLAIPGQPETSPSPGPTSPAQPDASPGYHSVSSPQQHTAEGESAATVDISMEEEQKERTEEREEEEMLRVAPQQEEPHQTAKESPEEEESVERTEGGEQEQEEEDQRSSSNCPPAGSVLAASPLLPQPAPPSPQPTAPHSALQPSCSPSSSPPASPLSSPPSRPPPPPRAGSVEVSPHRTALLPHALSPPSPPLEDRPLEVEAVTGAAEEEDKLLPCHVTSVNDDSQSQSQFEPVAPATEPTKDKNQSHAEPSERKEEEPPEPLEPIATHMVATPEVVAGQQPMRERQDAEDEEEGEEQGKGVTGKMDEEEVEEAREGVEQDQSDVEEEELVSPVLDLDPSLDMEVMALMTSSSPAPSLLHLPSPSPPPASRRGMGRTLRPPPCSSRPLDDLAIRLRQSPFSTEASPETSPARAPVTPPPLSPPSPPLRYSPSARESPPLSKPQAPPITVLPLTPKIGMGKPAISKRKFSPGRARVKQGSWWSNRRAVSPPSSSQDSMGEGGWDSPKPRPPDSPLWSMRVGRGSGFPGRRRSRGGGIGGGRGGRGRSRLKTQDCLTVSPGSVYVEPFQPKEEEENSMHNTVVMFSTSDHFTLKQDMCVVCGSFGQGAEGRLLACSQCGQCYHPYCVNVKITRVILTKGWRCLECTVCEACGEASDPGRLLLCDDCDISYHTYCLDPPLHNVPKGAWKCKWCVWCVQCGSSSPGLHCDWQNNYSRCGPCASLSRCPHCQRQYSQDELILQCQQCDRWVHAVCQGLNTEDEVEVAADEGFDCSLCRTHSRSSYGRSDSFDSPYMAQIISRTREPDPKTYTQDGVCLTESGLSHLQSLVEPLTSPRRYRRCKPKLKLRIINQNSVSVLQTPPDPDPPTEQDPCRGDLESEMKSDSSPERDHAHDEDVTKEPEVTDGNKKRKRKPYRPGIGGFMVRQRGGKAGPSRIKLCRKDSSETLPGRDEDVSMETAPPADQAMEKVKKRYRKKKTKLEEEFPSYLQEAFFGRDLLDQSRQVDRRPGPETPGASQSGAVTGDAKGHAPSGLQLGAMATNAIKKQGALPMSEDALLDLSDVLNTDPHILATGHTGQSQVERSLSPFAGLDISSMADDLTGSGGRGQRAVQEEPLDAILSPELDKMVTDGAILSKLYKIPELEGKDVEEVFTAVLSPNSSNNQQPERSQQTHTAAANKTHTHNAAAAVFPRLPLMNGLMGAAPHFHNTPMMPSGAQSPAGFRMPPPESPATAPLQGTALALGSANRAPAGEGEQDVMSTAQRGMLKWEKEETLGEMATVAPVLYCNTNFPQLREQYPDWSTRVKQIAKLWRKASSQDRAPFVQKARDNRAAQRINKVQLSNDPLKRHQPQQQPQPLPPPPGPYDPISMETEGAFKDPLRPKESEQEQEWKLRQMMRQKSKQLAKMEATQKLEQVKIEQLQQQRQQQLVGRLSPEAGSRSPVTSSQGSASPLHPQPSRQHLLLADDVFLRPQAPPPSGFASLPHSPLPSSPLHQPPSSPQMFSPPSSRPSSPWDPYSKVTGTPRPTSSQAGGPPAPQQQRHNSLSASPAHDAFGSPAPSPDSKTSDVPRTLGPQPGLQQSRAGMMSPSSSSAPDHSSRHVGIRTADTYQRTPHNGGNIRVAVSESYGRAGELVQGGLFKAPMPPQHQPQPEVFGSSGGGGGRRDPSRPTDLGFTLHQSQDPPFPSSPLTGLGSPHRSPYAQTPGTPRPDYSQQITDPFTQHSPLTSRPSPDPYTNPQTPGTPRPHSDPAYLTTPPTLRLDQYNQQSANHRPSPSHPNLDPYASNPGTPRPSVTERFPRSPGSQRSTDPYAQPAGTPRPMSDPYAQQPSTPRPQKAPEPFSQTSVESFTPQPAGSTSSPSVPGLSGETVSFTSAHHQLQQSPGRQQQQQQLQQQESFPRTSSSQTPKHPGLSEDSSFLTSQTPGNDTFEQGHVTLGPSQTDKTTTNEMAALAQASLDGPMSMLPQIGDSEEKLRQRQRLRQLILRQQQQKSALRQEKGLQETASGPPAAPLGPSPGLATPRHWSHVDSSTAAPTDPFGRPPPPYPGTVRPNGAAGSPAPRFPGSFPGEQQRGFTPSEPPFPRQSLPRELGVRGPVLRFGVPPGAPAGLQDSFLRPPQGSVPGSGLSLVEGVPVQMRRPMPGEFTGIRPLPAPGAHPHMMPGVPQPFLPRSLPLQQHSIMGQPYIELRHRAPENRLRLSFSVPAAPDPEAPLLQPRDPQAPAIRPSQTPLGQQMVMEQLNQQQHLGHAAAAVALTQSGDATLPGADGMEEHLEGEDSAVKDLEDVEVKDLVDLNLNLDPEDGKEDLDLGPNDLHLDDLLLSGKFDLIAYADPELNLEDKKDMFNEELDLGEPAVEKDGGERRDGAGGSRKTDSHSQCKQEVQDSVKTEARDFPSTTQNPAPQPGVVTTSGPPGPGAEAAGSSQPSLPASLQKGEDSGSGSGALPALQTQEQAPSSGMAPRVHLTGGQQSVFQEQQRPFGPSPSALFTPHPQGVPVSPHPSLTPQGAPAPPHPLSLQPPQPRLLLNPQTQSQAVFPKNQDQNQDQNHHRPLLLEEQPLLLQDLLDQERQEQQQQKQMQALIRQRSTADTVLPNMDFDSISDPIMKAKMVALKGINKVMTQGSLGLNPMVINRFQQAPVAPVVPGPEGTPQPPHLAGQDTKLNPQLVRPNPPSFGPGFVNESQRRQYEEWLGETQQLLQMQQRLLEDQIAAHRKTKKSLSAKQRTAKKAGRALAEEDAAQLRNITEQQGAVQKQLEQIRKQQKDHAELIEDYRTKQQQQRAAAGAPLLPQPMVSMQSHPGGPTPARMPNAPLGWTPGGGAPAGVMGQRMPLHLAPQMPPSLPNAPRAALHTQTPPPMVPGLAPPTAGFTAGPRGPSGGPTGAAADAAAAPPQVKFDDNNPFSEGFQERERRERLREQQERQRVQLMHEVERHRALQQRLELEQQGLLGASMGPGAGVAAMPSSGAPSGARAGQTPGPGGPAGSAPAHGEDSLSQMPFFSSELPQDFLQSPPASRPPPQHQGQAAAPFPQQAGLHQGFVGGPLHPGVHPAPGLLPGAAAERGRALPVDVAPSNLQTRPRLSGPAVPSAQGQVQVRSTGIGAAGMTPSHPGGQGHRFGQDSSSSSPSFPCSSSGGPASLIQLYSDIIPDDKPKKKRSRKREGDDPAGGGGARTPLSSHSDDITAPPTPAVSDTSCSTPTRGNMDQSDLCFSLSSTLSGLAPSSELEKQLSVISAAQQRGSALGMECLRGRLEVKEEREEGGACGGGVVKMEEGGGEGFSSPSPVHGGDGGKELLRHLLKDKTSPANTPSPTSQAPPTAQTPPAARRQLSNESIRSEEEDRPGSYGNMVTMDSPGPNVLDSSGRKKTQRCKRLARPEKDRAPSKNKKRKKEEEEKMLHSSSTSSSDPLMTHLRQLSVLPLMEPVLGVDLSLFPPYGSSSLGRDSRLTGSFGNACLDGVTDYYSQLIYKQNNLSNPPTPPASLPPTPPPVARQKLVNGFATTEELARKDITEQDVKGVKQKGEGLLTLNHASKTVDVPASLPTPPHNNQEEIRVQDASGRDSPDGFIPSSSPESVADMEVSRYPDLSFIKLEPPSPCSSPTIPMMPCAWGKGSAVKQEVKSEPTHQGPPSCSNTDLVTIAITLNPVAAQNAAGVMAAVAELLRVPVPIDYQLSRPAGPERSSLALLAGVRVPLTQGSSGSRQQRPPPPPPAAAARPQCCSCCKVLLGNGVRIVKELKQEGQSRPGSSLVFCSPNCSALYTSDLQSTTAGTKAAVPVVPASSERPPPSRLQHQYTSNMSSIAVHSLLHTPSSPPPTSSSSPPLSFPTASAITMETRPRMDSLKVKVKLKPRPRAVSGVEDLLLSRHGKRMKGCRWTRWSLNITLSRGPCIPNETVAMPTEEEVDVLLKKLGTCLRPDPPPKDQRRCCFCNQQGDGRTDGPARLLNLDLDLWVHLNCALWSSEVYETQAGALINVELALRRSLTLRCAHCQKTGATSGCNRLRCTNTYHFTCALQAHCTFFKDKTMLCHLHKPRTVPLSGDRSSSGSPSSTPGPPADPVAMAVCDPYDCELRCFSVFRRVFVQRDEARQIAAVVQRGERQHTFRVGSLLFRAVGRLLPQQMKAFHNKAAIFPIGYHANRIYWSMRHSNRRCKYMCCIEEQEGQPLFKVKVVEKGYDDLILTGPTPKAVWDQILEPISQMRSSSGTLKLFPVYLKGEDLFGLTTSAVTRIIESLPGVETCERYTFRYGRNPLMEWPLAFNPSGSARSEPKACQAKRPNPLTSIAPRCQGSVGSIVGLVPGVISLSPGESVAGAHQGRHSKSSQYRRMKAEWKTNVYLARSRIQGLGLYAARDIEKCTMVIEYIGTIIRSEVANRKERLYESQNRGVYMFRIDNDYVIDATITGGPARYINHSCSPNCITEVVTVEKENKIIISSCRRIQRGEELSYDYKFDLEDDQHKIPCHCGAVNCRKWMN